MITDIEPIGTARNGANVYAADDLRDFARADANLVGYVLDDAPMSFATELRRQTDCSQAAADQIFDELSWEDDLEEGLG